VVEESAEIDDGHLDLYSLEMKNLWKLALMLRSFRSGTHGAWNEVRTARCVEFDIETESPMPVNTDGEIVTATPAHFKVHPKAIVIFAPAHRSTCRHEATSPLPSLRIFISLRPARDRRKRRLARREPAGAPAVQGRRLRLAAG